MFIFGGFDRYLHGLKKLVNNYKLGSFYYFRPQMNSTLLPTILRHTPAGASTKMVVQYGQQVRSGRFAKYDYGRDTNMQVYGQLDPPEYHVENVKVPVATYWGKNDWLSHKLVTNLRVVKVNCSHYVFLLPGLHKAPGQASQRV